MVMSSGNGRNGPVFENGSKLLCHKEKKTTTAASASGRAVAAWCLYDFANSPFTTLVVTFIYAVYFTQAIALDPVSGTLAWSQAVTITALVVALLSPPLGVVADRAGYRKLFLLLGTGGCVVFSTLLYLPVPGQIFQALLWFTLANISFELASVFYNAFLPDIAPRDRIGRISGYGWALGYVGGLIAMGLALVGFVDAATPWFGFSREGGAHIRATNLLVAVWFALFSLPIFLWVRERRPRVFPSAGLLAASFRQLAVTFREVRRYREIAKLLLARLLYNDGLVTIFAFGGIYASGTFGFSFQELVVFGIVLNLAAGIGAFLLGYLDDRIGGKQTIQISLWGLILAATVAILTTSRPLFWGAALLMGLCSGPNQSASRSLLGRFVPPEKENEFFGLFAFSGKATAFLGPLLLGQLTGLFGSQRVGMGVVLLFFVSGLWLLRLVDEEKGRLASGRS